MPNGMLPEEDSSLSRHKEYSKNPERRKMKRDISNMCMHPGLDSRRKTK